MMSAACSGLTHQAATGVVFRDLRNRAAHVDIDDVGAELFDDASGVGHLRGITAKDLNRDGPFFFCVFRVFQGPIDAADQALAAHHFRDDETTTTLPFDEPAKRSIRHPRHWRDDKRRFEFDSSDLHTEDSVAGLVRLDVGGIHFDAYRLADQVH